MEYVSWLGWEDGQPWGTWTCHACDHKQTGELIRVCGECGEYPRWEYNTSIIVVAKAYLKRKLSDVICHITYALKIMDNKLDNRGV